MKILLAILLSLSALNAHATTDYDACGSTAVAFVQRSFNDKFHSPKVWVDRMIPAETNNFPNYRYMIYVSGEARGTWAHQSWELTASNMRGGCGVTWANMMSESFDQ